MTEKFTTQSFVRYFNDTSKDLSVALKGSLQLLFYICLKTNIEFTIDKKKSSPSGDIGQSTIDVDDFSDLIERLSHEKVWDLSITATYWLVYRGAGYKIEISNILARLRDRGQRDHAFMAFVEDNLFPRHLYYRVLGLFQEIRALTGLIRQIRNRCAHNEFSDDFEASSLYISTSLSTIGLALETYRNAFVICQGIECDYEGAPRLHEVSRQWLLAKSLYEKIEEIDNKIRFVETRVGSISGCIDLSRDSGNDSLAQADVSPPIHEIQDLISQSAQQVIDATSASQAMHADKIADQLLDLRDRLLDPWNGKDLNWFQALLTETALRPGFAPGPLVTPEAGYSDAPISNSGKSDCKQQIIENLLVLRRRIRDRLHSMDPSFEYYHCILMKPIVCEAVAAGVKSYQEFKSMPEFRQRILEREQKMLREQELYANQIEHLLNGGSLESLEDSPSEVNADQPRWFRDEINADVNYDLF